MEVAHRILAAEPSAAFVGSNAEECVKLVEGSPLVN